MNEKQQPPRVGFLFFLRTQNTIQNRYFNNIEIYSTQSEFFFLVRSILTNKKQRCVVLYEKF